MNNEHEIIGLLSKHLFWDVDISTLKRKEHSRFIIERIVTRGNYSDWTNLRKIYSPSEIKIDIIQSRILDKRTLSFLSLYYGIKKEKFRCYT